MLPDNDMRVVLALTHNRLMDYCRERNIKVPRTVRTKHEIVDFLCIHHTQQIQELVAHAKQHQEQQALSRRKRKAETQQRRRESEKRQRTEPCAFLSLPSTEQLQKAQKDFIDRTSNAALRLSVCVSCAREMFHSLGQHCHLHALEHPERLIPKHKHPAHETVDSMLVVKEHLNDIDNKPWGWFCNECLKAINSDRLPALALANRMWIGKIPPALMDLTVPEQILVSIYHPRCYVYKLHPRDLWSNEGTSTVQQNRLRGNVTTYELNMPDIVRMVEGALIPHPPRILSSLIAVSLIGAGPVPESWLKKTFSVRREVVHAAIHCLKHTTRHPGYQNIKINESVLAELPVDAVPGEIMGTMQCEPDINTARREGESYYQNNLPEMPDIPSAQDITTGHTNISDTNTTSRQMGASGNNLAGDDTVPDAIPLQYLGTVPTDLSKVSTEELFLYGLANGNHTGGKEGGYAVRPSKMPVPDFGRTPQGVNGSSTFAKQNLSVYAFPFLYPYGEGGIEMERDVPVGFQDHIRASLHYWDRRFRTNPTWPFVFFGILQKRQALNAARTQTRRKDFDRAAKVWEELKQEDFDEAAAAEKRGVPITNPRILLLKQFLTAAGVKVMGSDASRVAYRSQIWSTMLVKNPPSLWVTINPNDLHDPVVQVLAGEKIDMDNFVTTMGPSREERAKNITRDPYASAQYFHYIINLVLEHLFGLSVQGRRVETRTGVLGRLSAYYGVVEAQGRGSLHVHMVLWLEGAPSSDTMHTLLSDQSFRQRVAQYVDHSVRAHLDGLNADTIAELGKDAELGYSRPPCPGSANYDREFAVRELHLVRAQQHHKCHDSTCLIKIPNTNDKVCKRRAPFPLAPETVVSENGQILPKRTYGYLNNWNPFILVFLGCNNDIKFISNGFDARAIIWYITAYQTKKQQRSHNASALLAKGVAYHLKSSDYLNDIQQRNRLLISRCLRILNRQIEQSAPQAISYLLGYGDTFCSHSYVPLYWSSIAAEISRACPDLRVAKPATKERSLLAEKSSIITNDSLEHNNVAGEIHCGPSGVAVDSRGADESPDADDEEVIVEMSSSGVLTFRSQLTDYKLRGEQFEHMGFVTFVVDTWEHDFSRNTNDNNADTSKHTGRPRHPRAQYLSQHPRAKTHERVMRSEGHNTLPNIVGPYLPRSDTESIYDFYCASMLALLVPWRQITDLKPAGESWPNIFNSFLQSASLEQRNFISAAQYYYQCKEAVDHDRQHASTVESQSGIPTNPDLDHGSDEEDNLEDQNEFLVDEMIRPPRTEEELEEWLGKQQNPREQQHGTHAVDIAKQAGLFEQNTNKRWLTSDPAPHSATGEDLVSINAWREAMRVDITTRREAAAGSLITARLEARDPGSVSINVATTSSETSGGTVTYEPIVDEEIQPVDTTLLKIDQLRAYGIIKAHLEANIAQKNPEQLLMQIQGEGGTGKSTVIGCITELFRRRGLSHTLLRSAYTGIAASLIDGNTLHTLCRFTSRRTEISAKVLEALRKTWGAVDYLIIDEVSMISRPFLGRISNALGQAKQQPNGSLESLPFGGINVILTGDFHQFPPVACAPSSALYCPTTTKDTIEAAIGGQAYQAFRVVVVLQEQCRTTDNEWLDVLQHARHGTCTSAHLEKIRSLILPTSSIASDIDTWQDAVLVTPRHSVRLAWNQMATRRHCIKRGVRLFICTAEDTIDNRPLTIVERWEAGKKSPHRKADRGQRMKASLPDVLELAVGMEVMVTYNVETELDVANGSRGVVQRIIFDARETFPPTVESDPNALAELSLAYPPECVLVRLYRTKAAEIEGLGPGVVPIFPMTRKYAINCKHGKQAQVTRRQLPITAAYAFTDYRAQGQTIKKVIVDIARPPSGGLTPFNAYVALSRSSGSATIRLLRDFDDILFKQPPSHELESEDRRLLELNDTTKDRWEQGLPVWENLGTI